MIQIKICGITDLEDALASAEYGASHLGFNFYPPSPRYISPKACQEITNVLKRNYPGLKLVGVFVNSSVEDVRSILMQCSLDFAQLHGDEPLEMLVELEPQAYKAFRDLSLLDFKKYASRIRTTPAGLLDAKVAGLYGGTGMTADWLAACSIAAEYPIFLAGGLNPENVTKAISLVRPWGVDTASGVELRPGKKDLTRLKRFINLAIGAAENPGSGPELYYQGV